MNELNATISAMPKAELHVHLEGSVEPGFLHRCYPEYSLEEIRSRYQYEDFPGFLNCFKWVAQHLQTPEQYALAARDLFGRLHAQNVRYAEVMLSVGVLLWKEQDAAATFEALADESDRAPFPVRWIFDAIRQFPVAHAEEVVELAAHYRERGVVGFGIGGNEELGPARLFRDVFRKAQAAGLQLTVHGGETTGPASVWEALDSGAQRIGHGIRAVQDLSLVKHLAANGIPLEISITSNVRTRAVARLSEHPVRKLFDAGVPIVINTDDPALFETSLENEFRIAAMEYSFGTEEILTLAGNGFRYAFDAESALIAREAA